MSRRLRMKTSNLKKRRKKKSEKSPASREAPVEATSLDADAHVSGLPEPNPPKKNYTLLISVSAIFALWIVLLIWLCFFG